LVEAIDVPIPNSERSSTPTTCCVLRGARDIQKGKRWASGCSIARRSSAASPRPSGKVETEFGGIDLPKLAQYGRRGGPPSVITCAPDAAALAATGWDACRLHRRVTS
jgi:hypothetical protein